MRFYGATISRERGSSAKSVRHLTYFPCFEIFGTFWQSTDRLGDRQVAQLASRLDGLIALLEKPRELVRETMEPLDTPSQSESITLTSSCPFRQQLTTPVPVVAASARHALQSPKFDGNDGEFDDQSSSSSLDSVAIEALLDRGILSVDECDLCLASFREMNSYFPFVIISPRATVPSMVRESPFLLLAVLATASLANKSLQITLDKEFRAALSQEVIVRGEKSLNILQGLLVYIAWSVTLCDL